MICALHTLKKEYRSKKVYIWNVSRDSINLFHIAAFSRIDIQGFVACDENDVGERYMNRPVVASEQVGQEDSIILVSDKISKDTIEILPDCKLVNWSDALEINDKLRGKKVIIYGIGEGAKQVDEELSGAGMESELYCVTKRNQCMQHKGKKIIEVSELEKYEDYDIIVSILNHQYKKEVLHALADFPGKIYLEIQYLVFHGGNAINLIQSIDYAVKMHRCIYLYGKNRMMAEYIEEIMHIYDIELSGCVYETEDEEHNIRSIYELALEGIEDKLVIIWEEFPDAEGFFRARDNVELAGFSLENVGYTAFHNYTYLKEWVLNWQQYHDPLLGANKVYTSKDKPGYKVYGREEEDRIKIMVLGGSTSSEQYHTENWISKLYYKLRNNGIKTTIYNGAYPGDDIVEEILRVLRDGNVIQPQIIISMSGFNNLYYKDSESQFNSNRLIEWVRTLSSHKEYCSGIHSDESLYSFWSRNERLLKVIAQFYGAKLFAFLQPMNVTMSPMNVREKSLYETQNLHIGAKEFAKSENNVDGYINIMHMFEHQDEMYFDLGHYTDKAQEAIASKVYEEIMPEIITLENRKV